jgi:hypothetical protein
MSGQRQLAGIECAKHLLADRRCQPTKFIGKTTKGATFVGCLAAA